MVTATRAERACRPPTSKSFAPQIEASREESERNRSLPGPLVKAMAKRVSFADTEGATASKRISTNLIVIE